MCAVVFFLRKNRILDKVTFCLIFLNVETKKRRIYLIILNASFSLYRITINPFLPSNTVDSLSIYSICCTFLHIKIFTLNLSRLSFTYQFKNLYIKHPSNFHYLFLRYSQKESPTQTASVNTKAHQIPAIPKK